MVDEDMPAQTMSYELSCTDRAQRLLRKLGNPMDTNWGPEKELVHAFA